MRRLCLFHKICNLKSPKYLYNLIPSVNRFYDTRNNTNVPSFNYRTKYFKNSFFPNVITEWNKLKINIKSMKSYTAFKNALLSFIRLKHVDICGIHNPIGMQLLKRLWVSVTWMSTNLGIISVISLIPYVSVSWNQRRYLTFCYAVTYSR